MQSDRRTFPRIATGTPVAVIRPADATRTPIRGILTDASRKGFGIRIPVPLESDETIVIEVDGPKRQRWLRGRVRYVRPDDDAYRIGCALELLLSSEEVALLGRSRPRPSNVMSGRPARRTQGQSEGPCQDSPSEGARSAARPEA